MTAAVSGALEAGGKGRRTRVDSCRDVACFLIFMVAPGARNAGLSHMQSCKRVSRATASLGKTERRRGSHRAVMGPCGRGLRLPCSTAPIFSEGAT
jgi:hypothetical protein